MASESHPCLTTLFLSPPNLTTVILSSLPSPNVDHVYHKYWSSPNASTMVTATKKMEFPDTILGFLAINASRLHSIGISFDSLLDPRCPRCLVLHPKRPQPARLLKSANKASSTTVDGHPASLVHAQAARERIGTDVESTAQYYEYADHRPREPWTWTDEQRELAELISSVSGTYHWCLMSYTQCPCLLRWRANCINASTNDTYPSYHLRLTEVP